MSEQSEGVIVCGTDFSAAANEAATVAGALARALERRLVLVHVEEVHEIGAVDPVIFEKLTAHRRSELSEAAHRLRSLGTKVEERLLAGSAFEQLLEMAAACPAEMVVLGAVGHGLAQRLLLGSVAERVAENSPAPTLVVRPGSALASWGRGLRPLRVLAAYDFSAAGDAALLWLSRMQAVGPCEICVLHVDWPPEAAQRVGYEGALPLTTNPERIQRLLEAELRERVGRFLPLEKTTVEVQPGWGRPEANLFARARQAEAELIVVGTHQRRGLARLRFGSVSRMVLRDASASVAVIPPAEDRDLAPLPKLARVLVATDFSALGNRAVAYACAAIARGGTLKLIHILEPGSVSPPDEKREKAEIEAELRRLIPDAAGERLTVEVETVESRDITRAIQQEAARFRADLICLGSHGRTGLAKALLGSVAQGVMGGSGRPVLVVRGEE